MGRSTAKDYGESIAFLGQFGRFQQVVFFLLVASIVPNGFGAFTLVFVNGIPSHHCLVPEVNLTEEWRDAVIPVKVVNGQQQQSSCSRYRLDLVQNLSLQGLRPGQDVNLTELEQEGCRDGWSYSKDIYQSTIVSEFDLVCSDGWKQPFTTTIYFLGVLCGCFFAGQLSDRFGRKPILFATMAVQTIFTFIQVFSTSWIVFNFLLFINALGQMSNFVSALVLGAETLTGNVRVLYSSMGSNFGFAFGYILLPLCAYFFRSWTSLLLALSVPSVVYIPLWWFIPESPLWLLSKGRVEEAEAIVRKAAKWNKVEAPQFIFEEINFKTDSVEQHNIFDLLRNSNMRVTTIILSLVAFTMAAGYYGLSFNTSHLHANPYISCFISAVVEVPAYITSWLALHYLLRRLSIISTLLLTAVALYLIQIIPQNLSNLSVALEMVGKYAITSGFSLMFAVTTELYPTAVRNTATGICNTVARIGSCITPFLLKLSIYHKYLPYILLGSLAVVSAFATFFLPETFGRPLPETMEQMGKRKRLKCPCRERRETRVPVTLLESPL